MPERTLTVTQFIGVLNRTLEQLYPVVVEGEISQSTRYASGHWYFTIKDENSNLKCIMWRSTLASVRETFRVGDKVRLTGKPNVYGGTGGLSLICSKIERAGEGKLYELFLKLKKELEELGWFDQQWKKPIPRVPLTIGIITSQGAAALQDVMHRLNDRAPYAQTILYHTAVQGEGSAEQIAEAIRRANTDGRAEVLLLVRGGGSMEDLWSFNEKIVAQAIHESAIPIITGIGHETDFTIADMTADFRAPTPTGAAEAAAERREVLLESVHKHWTNLSRSFINRLERLMQDVTYYSLPFESPEKLLLPYRAVLSEDSRFLSSDILASYRLALTDKSGRLPSGFLDAYRVSFLNTSALLLPPIGSMEERLTASFQKLEYSVEKSLNSAREEVRFASRFFLTPTRILEPFREKVSSVNLNASIKTTLNESRLRLKGAAPKISYPFKLQADRCAELQGSIARGVQLTLMTEKRVLKQQASWLRLGRPKINDEPVEAACNVMRTAITQKLKLENLRLSTLGQVWLFLDPKRSASSESAFVFLNGKAVTSVKQVQSGDQVEVILKDGTFDARVGTVKQES